MIEITPNISIDEREIQEAFVRAWERLATFRGEAAFSTWLHRVTVNVVLGHRRHRGRRDRGLVDIEPQRLAAVPARQEQPGAALDLERAIARLPDRARTVFVLHDVEGYRHEDIASIADMAVGTSKAQLSRARRLLREALSP